MIASALMLLMMLQPQPELRQRVDAGLKAKAAGDLDRAAREFERVVELAPDLPAAHVNLGAVYVEKKDYARAIPPLRKALQLDPNLPGAEGMLGAALLAQGYSAEAVTHLEKAQSDDLLGVALLECGRLREAQDRLEAALEKRAGDPDLLYYLSQAHARLSKHAFDRLQESAPDSPRSQQMLGEAMAAAGKRDEAEKQFRLALAARPELRGVHFALGELFQESGDYEKAEAEFRAEVGLTPGSAATAYRLGVVLQNRGRAAEALVQFERADSLQPDMPETLIELGKARQSAGDMKGAERAFLRVIALEGESRLAATAHFQLAQVYRRVGRATDADSHQRRFQELRRRPSKR